METLQRTANRGSISTGFDIDNSVKMEADNSESMTRTPSSSGNRKTWTLSFWFKRTELGAAVRLFEAWDGSTGTSALFTDADLFILDLTAGGNYFTSSAVFRDTSAWYHFVIRVDTTQGTASERARVYVNGSELEGSWNSNIGQNTDLTWNQNVVHYLGVFHNSGNFANGYYAEVINVDGTSLAPTAFGEVDSDSGIWKPKAASPTYGTNGFYLNFDNSGSLGADSSGNGHNWTLNNITAADQATDTPTNNFATGNPLGPFRVGAWNFTEGATYAQYAGGNDWGSFTSTIAVGSGKWYVEIKAGGSDLFIGAGSENHNFVGAGSGTGFPEIYYGYTGTDSVGYHANNGNIYNNGSTSAIGSTYTTNDIISVALDMDNGKIYFAKNGTYMNSQNPATGANSIALPDTSARYFIGGSSYGTGKNHRCNYGGYTSFSISSGNADENGYGTFEYAPPSVYYALCTKNLAEYG